MSTSLFCTYFFHSKFRANASICSDLQAPISSSDLRKNMNIIGVVTRAVLPLTPRLVLKAME